MAFDDVLDDRQPEPGSTGRAAAAGIGAIEAASKVRQVLGRDPFSVVADLQHGHVAIVALERNFDRTFGRAVLESVVDQVADDLFELLRVAADEDRLLRQLQGDTIDPVRPCAIARGAFGQDAQIDLAAGLVVLLRLDPRQRQQVVDQMLQAPGFAQHGIEEFARSSRIRLVAFGSTLAEETGPYTVITLGHVVAFLQDHISRHWEVLRHVQTKEPVLGLLLMLEKARRGQNDKTISV